MGIDVYKFSDLVKKTPAVALAKGGKEVALIPNKTIAKGLAEHSLYTQKSLAKRAAKEVLFRRFGMAHKGNFLKNTIEELPDEVFENTGLGIKDVGGENILAREILGGITNPTNIALGAGAARSLKMGAKAAGHDFGLFKLLEKREKGSTSKFEGLI